MKKTIWMLLFILFGVIGTIAQTIGDSEWKDFSGYKEEFTVYAPSGFEMYDYNQKIEDSMKRYLIKEGNIYYAIFSSKDIESSHFAPILSFIQSNNADVVDWIIGSFKGKIFNFVDADGYSHRIAFVETNSRFFIIHAFGTITNPEKISHFFDSFKINQTFSQLDKFSFSFTPSKKTDPEPSKVFTTGGGQGVGRGQGSGSGGQSVENKPSDAPKPAPVTEPIQITSKPRANYTDMARLYWIQGTVTLRVTFSANGNIGGISVVSGLPLGLTKTSIEAARNLKFNPTKVNGIPQTVTKMLQYSFTIY